MLLGYDRYFLSSMLLHIDKIQYKLLWYDVNNFFCNFSYAFEALNQINVIDLVNCKDTTVHTF